MKKFSILAILLLFFTTGCSFFEKEKNAENIDAKKDNSTAYVVINGKTLYTDDFFKFAGVVLKEMNESDFKNQEVKNYLVKNFIEHNLLLQEAQRRNIKVDEKKISAVTESFLSEAGTQDLKVYSGSYDIDNYSQKEPSKKAHIFQIFTTDKQVAEKAMAELTRGLAFNEVAVRYSEGPEKEDGGDLGFIIDTDYPELINELYKNADIKYLTDINLNDASLSVKSGSNR